RRDRRRVRRARRGGGRGPGAHGTAPPPPPTGRARGGRGARTLLRQRRAPAPQGRGSGRALLRHLLAVADAAHAAVFLEVRTDNEPAHALYASEGFTVFGLRKRYYAPSGADAHTMRRAAT